MGHSIYAEDTDTLSTLWHKICDYEAEYGQKPSKVLVSPAFWSSQVFAKISVAEDAPEKTIWGIPAVVIKKKQAVVQGSIAANVLKAPSPFVTSVKMVFPDGTAYLPSETTVQQHSDLIKGTEITITVAVPFKDLFSAPPPAEAEKVTLKPGQQMLVTVTEETQISLPKNANRVIVG